MLVKVELTAAWADELGWTDADIAFVLDIVTGNEAADSPKAACPRCNRQSVDFKIRFFKYDSAAATAESIPGRGFVKCVCGTWYSYAVVDKMHGQTLVGQSHVPAPVAAKAPKPVAPPLTAWATIEDDPSAGRRHRTLEARDRLNVSAAEMWAEVEKQRRLEEGTD